MDSKLNFLILTISACVAISKGTPSNLFVMKEITLSEVTSQGILRLPSNYAIRNETYKCDYWITFLKDIDESYRKHNSSYGISIIPSNLELTGNDSISITEHPRGDDGLIDTVPQARWNSSLNSPQNNLEFSTLFQDVCLNLEGEWKISKATLIISLFFNKSELTNDTCPDGMRACKCSSLHNNRCISTDLYCNGVLNCGANCVHDENVCYRDNGSIQPSCIWSEFEYLLMMTMTGLLLVLIPVVFLLTTMYHRRTMSLRGFPANFDGNNNVNRSGNPSHIITMAPAHDTPPRYDDLPEEVKMPPRNNTVQP